MLRASLEATAGSVIENAERISPASSGSSHCLRCSSVANRCRVSMLPVSGAAQLIASGAISMLQPVSSASGEYSRLVRPDSDGQEQVPQPLLLGQHLQFLDHRRNGEITGPGLRPVLVVGLPRRGTRARP